MRNVKWHDTKDWVDLDRKTSQIRKFFCSRENNFVENHSLVLIESQIAVLFYEITLAPVVNITVVYGAPSCSPVTYTYSQGIFAGDMLTTIKKSCFYRI
jgi:hypothetical protein